MSQGRTLLTGVKLRSQNHGALPKRKGESMAMFEGLDRNRNIMIAIAVVVVAVIIFLYAAGYLSGII